MMTISAICTIKKKAITALVQLSFIRNNLIATCIKFTSNAGTYIHLLGYFQLFQHRFCFCISFEFCIQTTLGMNKSIIYTYPFLTEINSSHNLDLI